MWGVIMRPAFLCGLMGFCFLISATPAAAERNWEFSFGGYGGWAFHGDTTFENNILTNLSTGLVEPVNAKGTNLRFEDAGTFGAKLTAWHLPENTVGSRKSDLKSIGPGLPRTCRMARYSRQLGHFKPLVRRLDS